MPVPAVPRTEQEAAERGVLPSGPRDGYAVCAMLGHPARLWPVGAGAVPTPCPCGRFVRPARVVRTPGRVA